MSNNTSQSLPAGTTPQYANMHKWLTRGLFVCLTVLVFEGAMTFPLIAIWYGWPQLSLQQICSEFEKHRFSDDSLECQYPYPLFAKSEGAGQTTAKDIWGVQPKPQYMRIKFRQFVRNVEERNARKAAEAQASSQNLPPSPAGSSTPANAPAPATHE